MLNKSDNYKKRVVLISALAVFAPSAVYADSSWIWLTDCRPFDILPWVAAATIIIEVLAIWLIPKTEVFAKTAIAVILANAAPFLLPYLMLKIGMSWYGSFDDILNSGPNYIVCPAFLIITLCLEVPVVYKMLKSNVKNRKLLFWTAIAANAVTTSGVAIVERLITEGLWA